MDEIILNTYTEKEFDNDDNFVIGKFPLNKNELIDMIKKPTYIMNEFGYYVPFNRYEQFIHLLLIFKNKLNKHLIYLIYTYVKKIITNNYFNMNLNNISLPTEYFSPSFVLIYRGKNIVKDWLMTPYYYFSNIYLFNHPESKNINAMQYFKKNNCSILDFPKKIYENNEIYDLTDVEYDIYVEYLYCEGFDFKKYSVNFTIPLGNKKNKKYVICNTHKTYNDVLKENIKNNENHLLRCLLIRDRVIFMLKNFYGFQSR